MASARTFSRLAMSALGLFLFVGVGAQGCTVKSGDSGPVCGNGTIEGAEKCDDGMANGTTGHCKTDCSGPYYKYPTLADFCTAVATGECNSNVTNACGSMTDGCTTAAAKACNANKLPYHPQKAEDCVKAISDAWSDAALTHDEITSTNTACLPVFNKEGGKNATCTVDSDCDALNGLSCIVKLSATGSTGHCGTPVMVAAGDDCSGTDAQCDATHYCDMGGHCVSVQAEGKVCTATEPCDASLRCEGTTNKVCTARGMDGSACKSDDDCQGFCLIPVNNTMGKCKATDALNSLATNCTEFGG